MAAPPALMPTVSFTKWLFWPPEKGIPDFVAALLMLELRSWTTESVT